MKSNYANGFMGTGFGGQKKAYGLGGVAQDFLNTAAKKKEKEENYSPELEEFFKTGNTSALTHSVSQTILKDRIAQDKKDNRGVNSLSVWGKYDAQASEKPNVFMEKAANSRQEKLFYESRPVQMKKADKKSEAPKYQENSLQVSDKWEEKERSKKDDAFLKSIYEPSDSIVGYKAKTEYKAPKAEAFKGVYGKEEASSKYKNPIESQSFYKKDPVPKDVKLAQWEWDELEDFEKEWTIEGTKKQMEKDRMEKERGNYLQGVRKSGEEDGEDGVEKVMKKTPSPYEGYIENKGKMGYNEENGFSQKRNPQDYAQEIEQLNGIAMERARGKYNRGNIVIHTGEDPSSQIDKEDGKVHVWIDPNNMQNVAEKNEPVKSVSDPNIKIYDSRRIDNRQEQEAILKLVLNSEEFQQYKDLYEQDLYKREMPSYISEWRAHNMAYEILNKVEGVIEKIPNNDWSEKLAADLQAKIDIAAKKNRANDVDLNKVDKNGWAYDGKLKKRYDDEKNK